MIPISLDGEEHAKWRKVLDPIFTPRKVAPLADADRKRAETYIDAFVDDGGADVSWGQGRKWIEASLGRAGATEEEARKILGLNIAGLYRMDVEALKPLADRIGPTVDEVLTRASDQEISDLLDDASSSGRQIAVNLFGPPPPPDA